MLNLRKAKKLTTKTEFQLIERSQEKLEASDLKSLLSRARKYRNKYKDLSQRQALKAKAGSGVPLRTAEKAKLFENVVSTLQTKFDKKRKTGSVKAKPKILSSKKKTKAKPKRKPPGQGYIGNDFTSPRKFSKKTRAKRVTRRLARSSTDRILGDVSSRNKRNQKRRDVKNA